MKRYVKELGNDIIKRINGMDIQKDKYTKQISNIIKAYERGIITSIESSRQILNTLERAFDEDIETIIRSGK